jgi:hypothetical protein
MSLLSSYRLNRHADIEKVAIGVIMPIQITDRLDPLVQKGPGLSGDLLLQVAPLGTSWSLGNLFLVALDKRVSAEIDLSTQLAGFLNSQ